MGQFGVGLDRRGICKEIGDVVDEWDGRYDDEGVFQYFQ